MPRKTRASRKPTDRSEISYDEYSSAGAGPRDTLVRENVAPGAQEFEGEDYDEQNRRNVGGEGGEGIQTGNYEEDYGPGARGLRNPEFQAEPATGKKQAVLRRTNKDGKETEEFPSGAWAAQRAKAKMKTVKSGKARARGAAGRGVGVRKRESDRKRVGSTIRHPRGSKKPKARRRA